MPTRRAMTVMLREVVPDRVVIVMAARRAMRVLVTKIEMLDSRSGSIGMPALPVPISNDIARSRLAAARPRALALQYGRHQLATFRFHSLGISLLLRASRIPIRILRRRPALMVDSGGPLQLAIEGTLFA